MKKLHTIPIKTIQIKVDTDLYNRIIKKKGKRNWYRFMYDITED